MLSDRISLAVFMALAAFILVENLQKNPLLNSLTFLGIPQVSDSLTAIRVSKYHLS